MQCQIEIARDALRIEVSAASAVLKGYPRMANGMTPDSVKFSPEYRSAKLRYDHAFDALRKFNTLHKPARR